MLFRSIMELLWCWRSDTVVPLLEKRKSSSEIYFFDGYAQNIEAYYHYFDKLFLLVLDRSAVERRLAARASGDWGKDPAELRQSLEDLEPYQHKLQTAGAISIDAALPLDQVVSRLLAHVANG